SSVRTSFFLIPFPLPGVLRPPDRSALRFSCRRDSFRKSCTQCLSFIGALLSGGQNLFIQLFAELRGVPDGVQRILLPLPFAVTVIVVSSTPLNDLEPNRVSQALLREIVFPSLDPTGWGIREIKMNRSNLLRGSVLALNRLGLNDHANELFAPTLAGFDDELIPPDFQNGTNRVPLGVTSRGSQRHTSRGECPNVFAVLINEEPGYRSPIVTFRLAPHGWADLPEELRGGPCTSCDLNLIHALLFLNPGNKSRVGVQNNSVEQTAFAGVDHNHVRLLHVVDGENVDARVIYAKGFRPLLVVVFRRHPQGAEIRIDLLVGGNGLESYNRLPMAF